MAKKIGITGGIGTGKSFVSKIFKTLGVPFYDADYEAKAIMSTDDSVRKALTYAFGMETYCEDGSLNRKWLAAQVFNDEARLKLLNSIVHPAVIAAGESWSRAQRGPYSLKEAALLFESGSYKFLDYTILVTAPLALRIARVQKRDGISSAEVMQRINNQMPEEEKVSMADFILINDEVTPLLPQIEKIHSTIIAR